MAAGSAGLGFGLVIAPISTSALNAAPAAQAGVASSVVTVLRMTGMMLGLAALTSYGLARFRTLAAQLGSTPGAAAAPATVTLLTHQVLTETFGLSAVIALLGTVPALFLWRRAGRTPATDGEYRGYVAPLA